MLNLNESGWQTHLHRLLTQENHNKSFVLMHIQRPVNTNRHFGRLKVPFRIVTPTPAVPEWLFSFTAADANEGQASRSQSSWYPTLALFFIALVLAFLQVCSSSSGHLLSSSWHQWYKTLVCYNATHGKSYCLWILVNLLG